MDRIPNTECMTKSGECIRMEWLDISWLELAEDNWYATYDKKWQDALDAMIQFVKDTCKKLKNGEIVVDDDTKYRYYAMRMAVN